ncbi:MAG TPA: cupin domain-containing protein [Candidatus Acidoferrales bacterium]|nr:cupin domain-containing protein [Candidatus Acidoferrales bacterium]
MRGLYVLLLSLMTAAITPARTPHKPATKLAAQPLILEKADGEKRVRRPIEGSKPAASVFFLKIDPKNGGSKHLVMGLEQMAPGGVIPMHKHLEQDEILFIQNGTAHVTLGSREQDVHGGATVFIPQGTWISVKNTGSESIGMVFVFSAPGYENYMRCTSVPFGQPVRPMTLKERDRCMAPGEVMYK